MTFVHSRQWLKFTSVGVESDSIPPAAGVHTAGGGCSPTTPILTVGSFNGCTEAVDQAAQAPGRATAHRAAEKPAVAVLVAAGPALSATQILGSTNKPVI